MAACVGASRTTLAEPKPLPRDPNRSQFDENKYSYVEFCRPSFPLHVSYKPICPDRSKSIQTDANRVEVYQDEDYSVDLRVKMRDEPRLDVEHEPILSNYYYNSIYARHKRVNTGRFDPCGTVHITSGDGGYREGLAHRYVSPQPVMFSLSQCKLWSW